MNYPVYITLVSWETRNRRHRERAVLWCKDYGLKSITKHLFVGELYKKERLQMKARFETVFTGKTEKFFFVTMCKSCFNEGVSDDILKNIVKATSSFELVQVMK